MATQTSSLVRTLLELIAASGGATDTRIRIQKEAFLLAAMGESGLSVGDFDYHHYGPFSRALSDALHSAVNLGLLREMKESFESGSLRYTYALAEGAKDWIEEGSPHFERLTEIVSRLKEEHWRTLELAATVIFLERRHKLASREISFAEAMRKKPDTRPYEKEARSLLQDLRI
jgi:uncharacterized protein YwgA